MAFGGMLGCGYWGGCRLGLREEISEGFGLCTAFLGRIELLRAKSRSLPWSTPLALNTCRRVLGTWEAERLCHMVGCSHSDASVPGLKTKPNESTLTPRAKDRFVPVATRSSGARPRVQGQVQVSKSHAERKPTVHTPEGPLVPFRV